MPSSSVGGRGGREVQRLHHQGTGGSTAPCGPGSWLGAGATTEWTSIARATSVGPRRVLRVGRWGSAQVRLAGDGVPAVVEVPMTAPSLVWMTGLAIPAAAWVGTGRLAVGPAWEPECGGQQQQRRGPLDGLG